MIALAALAFIAIFFFAVPFPIIICIAALIGFVVQKMNPDALGNGAGHAPAGGKGNSTVTQSLLGDAPVEHTRPSLARVLKVAAIWLPLWLAPLVVLLVMLGSQSVFTQIAIFFSKMAVVTFGGAYAVLAYVAQQAVNTYGWLKPGEMLDGLGMAETTPGPLIMVLQFVGFMAAYRAPGSLSPMIAGTLGGLLATWVTFTPCFLWIFAGAPYIETLRGNKALNAALSAITAAVVGVILNLAVWFAVHSVFHVTVPIRAFPLAFDAPAWRSLDPWAFALSVAAAIAIFRFKVGMIPTLAACCAAGVGLFLIGAIA
jgi:chromate transporter